MFKILEMQYHSNNRNVVYVGGSFPCTKKVDKYGLGTMVLLGTDFQRHLGE